jgi:hypothetical protein
VTDFSKSKGASINDHARPTTPFNMMGLKEVYAAMTPGCWMAKIDIQSDFRAVSVQPNHWDLTRDGVLCYYGDKRFPFGLSRTPETFNRLSRSVRAMMSAK